jgi:hypothetical protein
LRANKGVETFHRFQIVIKHIGDCLTDGGNTVWTSVKVGGKDLDTGGWNFGMYSPYTGSKMACTFIGKIVSGDRGDHHMLQIEFVDGMGQTLWFVFSRW